LYYASILHDIGMVAVHNLNYLPNVLSKTIERTPDKLHPLLGAELVKDIKLLSKIAPIIQHHHEYVDGSGHPDGLVGTDIPLASRIICLCEHLDDLIMKGLVGDELMQKAKALAIEGSGTKFDKDVVDAYLLLT
jgi:HD-GYP domain-containing protein (c-di-GMP phosphodiesterase class II)